MGGDFFYSEPKPLCIKMIDEDELSSIRESDSYIPKGLQQAFMSFLVSASDLSLSGKNVCNFMIHPSVKISDQDDTATKIAEFMNLLLKADESEIRKGIEQAWKDLHDTKPDIKPLEEVCCKALSLLDENNQKITLNVMNSQNEYASSYETGFNIIVGGNTLGRGITFPALQTIYYCRKSRMPQADTYWQHCRMFGYDRDRGLMRIFIPQSIFKTFTDMNYANMAMIKQIEKNPVDQLRLIYPPTIRPTRRNVIENNSLVIIAGGVNYFPFYPSEKNTQKLDNILSSYNDESEVNIDFLIDIIENISLKSEEDWSPQSFINCLKAWKASKEPGCTLAKLIVRRDRNIAYGTGTLLSPTDRNKSDNEKDKPVLILYRVNGQKQLGWNGYPLWIPNIKMPGGKFFYNTVN